MEIKVICISGKAQHGKDTTANFMKDYLEEHGKRVLIAHFGDLLKYICTYFFDWDGHKDERGRTLLQYVGTDVIRNEKPDYWVDFISSVISLFKSEWDYVLLPDCRFPNEYEKLKAAGLDTTLLRVERPNFQSPLSTEQQQHLSETALDCYKSDLYIVNYKGLKQLQTRVFVISEYLLGA